MTPCQPVSSDVSKGRNASYFRGEQSKLKLLELFESEYEVSKL